MGAALVAALLALTAWSWWDSRLPAVHGAEQMGVPDLGGGAGSGAHYHGAADPVADRAIPTLVDPRTGPPDVRLTLTARAERLTLADGTTVDGYTIDGTTPGPVLRVRHGDLVEVVLHNEDVAGGTTLHWHGLDVPNAMDGVAGITQDAVRPGASFTYRFEAGQVGPYWYHSHQMSHRQVIGGMFGALVVEPRTAPAQTPDPAQDALMVLHTYPRNPRTVNGTTTAHARHAAEPGSAVRVRVVNTDNAPVPVWVAGSAVRVLAIDGTEVAGPTSFDGERVTVTAGGRADLEVTVPAHGAARVQAPGVSLSVGPDGAEATTAPAPAPLFDPLTYGTPGAAGFDPAAADRHFRYDIGRRPGFLDGRPGWWWTINGGMGRHVPMYMVEEGDVVRMTVSNHSGEVHPMHLHGHHLLVLSRDGRPATGSPWWVDSLNVEHGESYEVAFVADDPGIWMDHCHNLPHAREGLMTHLMYAGVGTPYLLGRDSGNVPE